jgi:hypothetical protein
MHKPETCIPVLRRYRPLDLALTNFGCAPRGEVKALRIRIGQATVGKPHAATGSDDEGIR